MIRRLFLAAALGAALIACTPSDGPGFETAAPPFTPTPTIDASPSDALPSDALPTVAP